MTCPEDGAASGDCRGPHRDCLCAGAGPAVSRIVSELFCHVVSPETRQHFDRARLEFLMGLRALLDERIKAGQKGGGGPARGTKVTVD